MKRYMLATGRASLLISERTAYNVSDKAINTRISVIPYSFAINQ